MSFFLRISFWIALTFYSPWLIAQSYQVPDQMLIGDVAVRIDAAARGRIMEKVNSLTASRSKYQEFLDRSVLHFPLIERVLTQENVPTDFKFLALQESALLPEAVSKSNAVGYWQFKEATAQEQGVVINAVVDERKNIIASTRAAAQYLKKANKLMNNWVYAMLAYHDGPTGAYNKMPRELIGAKSMDITAQTDQYILHFLAHKIVFEEPTRNPVPPIILAEYLGAGGKSWSDVEDESNIQAVMLRQFNAWLNAERVPTDKTYSFILPVPPTRLDELTRKLNLNTGEIPQPAIVSREKTPPPTPERNYYDEDKSSEYPVITVRDKRKIGLEEYEFVIANNLKAVIPPDNVTFQKLIDATHKKPRQLRRWNNMDISADVEGRRVYYLQRKKGKAYGTAEFHIFKQGETLWQVAQLYGMRLKKLHRFNRLLAHEEPEPGTVLWLKKRRPKGNPEVVPLSVPIRYNPVKQKYEQAPSTESITYESPIITPNTQSLENDTAVLHIVQRGETLFGIARAYQLAPIELIELNNSTLPPDRTIQVGQPLIIRRKNQPSSVSTNTASSSSTRTITTSDGKTLYIVRQGETLSEIVDKYPGTSLQELIQWNGLTLNSVLKQGDTIIVRGGAKQPATPVTKPSTTTSANLKSASVAPTATPSNSTSITSPKVVVSNEPYQLPSAVWQQKAKTHTVQKGETGYGITKRYGISLRELIEWNNLNDKGWVSVGQILIVEDINKINLKEKLKETGGYYTVQPGDNLFSITNKFGVTIDDLVKWNNINEQMPLVIGQELIVDYNLAKSSTTNKVQTSVSTSSTKPANTATSVKNPVSTTKPSKAVGEEAVYHVVIGNETLERIASEYGISVLQLREWNNLSASSQAVKGAKLIVGYQKVKDNTSSTPTVTFQPSSPQTSANPTPALRNNTNPDVPPGVRMATTDNQGYYLDEKPQTPTTPAPASSDAEYHVVQRSETLYSISVKYKTTVDKIKQLNNKTDNSLTVGERLRVR